MDPQKLPEKDKTDIPVPTPDKSKPIDSFPPEDTTDLSLSEEPVKPVTVVPSDPASTPPEPPKPPVSSESYSPLGAITPPSASDVPVPQAASHKKKWGLIGLIVGVILLLLGGSAAAYFGYYLPNQPENILKSALVNSFSAEKASSVHFNGEVKITDTASDSEFTASLVGVSSQNGQMELKVSVDAQVTTVKLDLLSVDGKSYFVKLGGLEGLPELLAQTGDPNLQSYGALALAVNEQWYEINESLIKEWTGTTLQPFTFSDEELQKLGQAYEQNQFLSVKETLPSENINGKDSYHYKVTINKEKLKDFIKAVKDANIEGLKITQQTIDGLNGMLANVDFAKYPIDVWIDKETKLFNQMSFKNEQNDAVLESKITITDYNKPVDVKEPEDAKSILEALNDIFSATGGLNLSGGLGSDVPDNMLQQLQGESSGSISL